VAFSGAGDLIADLGLDAAGPAAFLALLWPRLASGASLRTAIAGGAIAIALIPFTPPGVPILAAMFGVAAARLPWPTGSADAMPSHATEADS
jgi:predicted branched-subunit amino acid permease